MGIDPIPLDTQVAREGGRVHQPGLMYLGFLGTQQLNDAARDCLNQLGLNADPAHRRPFVLIRCVISLCKTNLDGICPQNFG